MGIMEDMGQGPVCLDTCVFIYYIEEDGRYIQHVAPFFEAIDKGTLFAVTSGITLLETLVIPLRNNELNLANQYEKLLLESRGLTCLNLSPNLLRLAAHLRATYQLKTPDALQIAAAKLANCQVFITNDRRLPKIPDLKIVQLSAYI